MVFHIYEKKEVESAEETKYTQSAHTETSNNSPIPTQITSKWRIFTDTRPRDGLECLFQELEEVSEAAKGSIPGPEEVQEPGNSRDLKDSEGFGLGK